MTESEKARAYDEALERANKLQKTCDNSTIVGWMEYIFPELVESKDEKIRKELLEHCKNQAEPYILTGNKCPRIQSWIAWLEKQADKDKLIKELDEYKVKYTQEILTQQLEKRSKQTNTNNVEPKFKVGNWVVRGDTIAQILDIQEQFYVGLDINGRDFTSSRFLSNDKIHLWTIQDAKDGDILAAQECYVIFKEIDGLNIKCHCTYHYMGFNPSFYINTLQNKTAFQPATKEQCDILFQKMKEAGYEWDAKNKELKLLISNGGDFESTNSKQKPAWSEEDEDKFNKVIDELTPFGECPDNPDWEQREYYYGRNAMIDWLKSLKERFN